VPQPSGSAEDDPDVPVVLPRSAFDPPLMAPSEDEAPETSEERKMRKAISARH
jgi:hypothetical protein